MNLIKKINKNLLNIVILFFIFYISYIFYISFVFVYFNYINVKEGLKDMYIETSLSSDFAKSFCESNQLSGEDSQKKCQTLTQNNCRSTSCCIWTSNEKCHAGGEDGLLFNTDSNGKLIDLDYYYFKDTCYGKKCK